MVFSEQYKYNTLKNEVSFGVGRFRIYASRWVVSLLVLAALYLVLVLVYALASLILLGPAQPGGRPGDVRSGCGPERPQRLPGSGLLYPGGFPLWLGGMSLAIACHFLITNSTIAAFSYLGILMVLPMALNNLGQYVNPLFTSLYHLTLNYHMDQLLVGDLPWSKIGQCWLIGLGWTVVSTALGAVLFSRKEIK